MTASLLAEHNPIPRFFEEDTSVPRFMIKQTRHFYGPETRTTEVENHSGGTMMLHTRQDAEEWVGHEEGRIYVLGHNESGRPTYEIVEVPHADDFAPEEAEAFGFKIQRGYVFEVVADDDDSWEQTEDVPLEDGSVHVERTRYGYFGDDTPPCAAEYLMSDDDELLVISSESDPDEIPTASGFSVRRVQDLDWAVGKTFSDGTWGFVVLGVDPDGRITIAGKA